MLPRLQVRLLKMLLTNKHLAELWRRQVMTRSVKTLSNMYVRNIIKFQFQFQYLFLSQHLTHTHFLYLKFQLKYRNILM